MSVRIPVENSSAPAGRHRPSPGKLLQSKWTAIMPRDEELHFVVTCAIGARSKGGAPDRVELRAVLSGRRRIVAWGELVDRSRWQPGWL